jgi:hypothetical protein
VRELHVGRELFEMGAERLHHRLLAHRFDGAAGLLDFQDGYAVRLLLLQEVADLHLSTGDL